ncbi:MAG TPA: hypothetical protein VFM18_13300 [Methanosarcina sp.]|nr:hypothetical protein [Methanosarcina sp.]
MTITSKQSLIDYALRSLGSPIVEINVTEEQISDRLNDTLKLFQNYHYNGMQRTYITHQITEEDITNRYITIPDNIVGISRVMPYVEGSATGTASADSGLFSVQYQVRLNDLWNINSGSAVYYQLAMMNMAMLDQTFNGQPFFRFTQVVDKLYLDVYWGATLQKDMYVAVECFITTDPNEYNKIWDEIWFKEYFIQAIKRQWGENMKKFGGIQTIGGVTINGQEIYEEAKQEMMRLEQQLRDVYEEPPVFFMG